jgi:SAM-dependent methyltransferase
MESDEMDFETYRACLVDLSKVNFLTLAYRPTIRFLSMLASSGRWPADRTVEIADVGSGYGDMLRKIDRWALRHGKKVNLTGIDLSPWSARSAAEVTSPDRPIRYVTASIFDYRPAKPIDVVISSLLTHHLDNDTLVRFIQWMDANSAIAWFINDLHRKALPYRLFSVATRALRIHDVVRLDGLVSIARSFDTADWESLLYAAGVRAPAAKISRKFPYRLCVSRLKT